MISVAEVDKLVRLIAEPSAVAELPLAAAAGRCLRERLIAKRPAPPFDRVMMDGFALRAEAWVEGVRSFRIEGSVSAGEPTRAITDQNGAIEVMTGAVLPPGTDCVVPIEACGVSGDRVEIRSQLIERGQFVHRAGSDAAAGVGILESGSRLHAGHIALAASEGYDRLVVNRDLRVCLITTGDEIVFAGAEPEPWQIFGTHAAVVGAALAGRSDLNLSSLHVGDTEVALTEAIREGANEADVVVLCGAMSKGRKDHGIGAVGAAGFEVLFHRVAQRPGHPMALGRKGAVLLFGLPGNPLAVAFTFYRHVLPTLDLLRGGEPVSPIRVKIAEGSPTRGDATRYVPARLCDGRAIPVLPQNSGDLHCLRGSDGFLEIPPREVSLDGDGEGFFRPWI